MTSSDIPSTESSSSFDEEWEEWDGSSPFWVHCVAGSLAGVTEHTLVYPLDTVRTHIQVCAACNFNGANHPASKAVAATASESYTNAAVARTVASSSASKAAVAASQPVGSVLQKAASTSSILMTQGGNSSNNLTMIQAIRQLMSQPLVLEGAAGRVGASNSTSSALKSATESVAAATTEAAVNTVGLSRLWRGVQTILIGCIPAHALYFSSYETVKAATLDQNGNVTAYGSILAGGAAVISHDLILGPLDTVKQRLQLGHYRGLSHALTTMIRDEGAISLFRSFPITLATNIPYGMVMVGTNEFCKQQWSKDGQLTLGVTLGASSLAGLVAAATTTPLDRIKTYLQTQQLSPACMLNSTPNVSPEACPLQTTSGKLSKPIVADWRQAAMRIYQTEGTVGFFRGMTPRILSHTPAVAISWTTYETAKRYLLTHSAVFGDE
ncbi:mitochondrial carrier protein [Nitzschia inconspicua]|uniref:Mitochondrial carrier protein n=1 Tax=Nitzschia inconspicua TaxID=303405 RepID=A0A9K3L1V0_9STRA|nr:mitochondrial carrier protein [Nitzschia inconspicua]